MVTSAEAKANISYEEASRETIQKREDLQASVIKHTNRIVDQVNRSLREMETIINQDLSPIHLRRIIDFIREDLEPVKTFIRRISSHAEQIGSLKKEHEMRKTIFYHSLAESLSSTTSDSNHSAASYLVRRNARKGSPAKSDRLHINDLSNETYTVNSPVACRGDYRDRSRESRRKCRKWTDNGCESRSRSKSAYFTPNCSPDRLPERLWTPPAYKRTDQTCSRRKESMNRCRDCRMRVVDCRCQERDEVDCISDSLKEMRDKIDSELRLDNHKKHCKQCSKNSGDNTKLEFLDAPVTALTVESSDVKVASTLPWRVIDWCMRLKHKLTGNTSMGALEKLIVLLVAYLGYQWWKGILYRLGVVYRVYTGDYDTRGVPSM